MSLRNGWVVGPAHRSVALAAAVALTAAACSGGSDSSTGSDPADERGGGATRSAATVVETDPPTSAATTIPATTSTTATTETTHPPAAGDHPATDETASDDGTASPPPAPDAAFVETFDTPESLDRFDFAIHHAVPYKEPFREWIGDHDDHCGPPPTTRTIALPGDRVPGDGRTYTADVGDSVYWCAPDGTAATAHFMTTMKTRDYAQIDFSPKQVFHDVRRVCWDQNMTDLGVRKWTQLVVVDMDTFERNDERMDYVSPRVDDGPASFATQLSGEVFLMEVLGGSSNVHIGHERADPNFQGFLTTDKKRRFTICVTDLEDGTVEVAMEREATTEHRIQAGGFPDGPVRVIFQDDTYNAPKSPPTLDVADPFTWHWDDVVVEER